MRHNGAVHERVMVVEDDPELRRHLAASLTEAGFDVAVAATGSRALEVAAKEPHPELILLDIGLPDADGRDLCQAIKAQGSTAPVIFLTAREALTDRISGFGAGGDDYLVKPFAFAELHVRIEALLRRPVVATDSSGIVLDPLAHGISGGNRRVDLTPTEFRLLATLMARPGEVVRRRSLILAAWPDGAAVSENTLDVYLSRLRHKIREIGTDSTIVTLRGVGYRWQ